MKKLRIGVVGLGDISRVYLNNLKKYSDYVTIEACASRTLEKAQKKADAYGIPHAYSCAEELIEQADVLLVQMEINVDALEHVIRIAHESGVRVILNPAPVQKIADEMMAMVDTVTPNETEAAALTGVEVVDLESAHRAARVLLNKGVRNVIITLGGNGVYCTDGTREELIDRIAVNVVDTTGAGDAFNGGFATALSNGMELFDAVRYGNCTGALSVTKPGTAKAMPCKAEIDALYQARYGG